MNFRPGDKVVYNGVKLKKELGARVGEVCASVALQDGAVVVDYADDSYILAESNLSLWVPGKNEQATDIVTVRRRKRHDEED